jgi:uncharacterized membrane protein
MHTRATVRRVGLKHIPIRPRNPFMGWGRKVHVVLAGLLVAAAIAAYAQLWLPYPLLGHESRPEALLLFLSVVTTLTSLWRQLPGQNMALAGCVIALIGGAVHLLCALVGIPFGPIVFDQEHLGRTVFHLLPWSMPLIWVVIVLNSRGVARLILRRCRHKPYYGFWVIGLATMLVVIFTLSFEPFATHVKQYWSWKATKIPFSWYDAPLVNFLGWAVTTLVMLLWVTPALINKSPRPPAPPSFFPLLVWELLNGLFLAGSIARDLRAAAIFTASQMVLALVLCWTGWKPAKSRGSDR